MGSTGDLILLGFGKGRVRSLSGRVVSYAQSNAGRTLSATGSGLTYGANGALLGAVWNGTGATRLVESRSYNWLGQMRVAEVKKGGSELKWKITGPWQAAA